MKTKDVHTEHCCIVHGCKYNEDELCTVMNGNRKQSHPCEYCKEEGIDPTKENSEMNDKEESYFVFTGGDGEVSCDKIDKNELLKRLSTNNENGNYYGNKKILIKFPEIMCNLDLDQVVIIKGKIVIPKEKKVVTEYEIE